MFYAHFVLSKKGPLARIWLAAHWDKKLTKAHVFETNIEGSVEAIIQPKVKLALRTSGHLLLGVVRIYSRKAKYLLADCNEAFVKIKMAFRPGMVDLPEENREAALSAITLAEAFHDFDSAMADLNDIDVHAQFAVNQSRPEEITMREELGNITLVGDDGFGDMGFDGPGSLLHDAHMDDTLYMKDSDHGRFNDGPDDLGFGGHRGDAFSSALDDYDEPAGIDDDDDNDDGGSFGGDELFGDNFVGESGGLFEDPIAPDLGLSSDGPRPVDPFSTDMDPLAPPMLSTHDEAPRPPVNIFNDFMGTTLPSAPTSMETEPPMLAMDGMNTSGAHEGFRELPPDVPSLSPMRSPLRSSLRSPRGNGGFMMEPPTSVPPEIPPNISEFLNDRPPPSVVYPGLADQTTLLADDKEAFALEPIDVNTVGAERKIRKKRKLVIDEQKAIASETMKLQLSDSSEIVTTLDLAPPTKKLMHWKETGGVEKLFSFPGRPIVCKRIFKLFNQNLITKSSGDTAAALPPVTPAEPRERVRRAGRSSAAVNQTAVEDSSTAAINGSTLLSAADTPAPLDHDDERIAAINDMPLLPLAAQENSLLTDDTTSRLAPPDLTSSDPSFLDPSRTPLPLPRLTSPHSALPPESDERGLQLPQLTSPHRDPSLNFSDQGHIPPGSPANSLPSLPPYHPVGGGSDDDNDDMGGGYDDDYADDDDDYAGNNQAEPDEYRDEEEEEAIEPIEGEGEEQAEERRWNKRSQQMRSVLSKVLVRQPTVTYREMVSRNSRKQAASKFYTFLVMKKLQAIDIRQDEPYGDITISKGPAFDSVW